VRIGEEAPLALEAGGKSAGGAVHLALSLPGLTGV